ncbi:MAG TPA: hypothetical protein VKU62_09740 [Thermoanaerobaculia bacterium]|nr:hypothetical protein [Thermoanaerobaculia bacterium]
MDTKILLWMSLAARLAPLFLMTSAALVATRWVHDRLAKKNRYAGVIVATIVVVAGLWVIIPYAARMGLILGIRSAEDARDWDVVSQRVQQYEWWGGALEGNLLFARGMARAHEGRLGDAANDFAAAADSGDPLVMHSAAVFQEALCFYSLHREDAARRLLLTLPDKFAGTDVRDYLLGRIAEHQGDAGAESWFRKSLEAEPSFTPALYRLLRILSQRHDVDGAMAVVAAYRRANPEQANAPYLAAIVTAIQRGEVLIDYEPLRLNA